MQYPTITCNEFFQIFFPCSIVNISRYRDSRIKKKKKKREREEKGKKKRGKMREGMKHLGERAIVCTTRQ